MRTTLMLALLKVALLIPLNHHHLLILNETHDRQLDEASRLILWKTRRETLAEMKTDRMLQEMIKWNQKINDLLEKWA